MNCSKCETTLLIDVFGTSNPIRCSACGAVTIPPDKASTQVNRYAWRSFWLGLSSIVLLCFTGLPAIWYGVQSLLQMRFSRSQKSDRKAAVAGVTLGILFGIVGAGIVAVIAGVILIVTMSIEESNDPKRIQEILSTIGKIEVPEGFEFDDADLMKGQFTRVQWNDMGDTNIKDGRIRLLEAFPKTQVGSQLHGPTVRFRFDSDIEIETDNRETESLSWKFAGKSRSITKFTEPVKNQDFNVVRYYGSTKDDAGETVIALNVSIRDDSEHTEEDVKKIFESFQKSDE